MKTTSWEIKDENGISHTLSFERYTFKPPKIFIDNEQLTLPTDFANYLSNRHDVPFKVGQKECHFILRGKKPDVFCDGVSIITGKEYEQLAPMPAWTWAFVAICLAAVALLGALPFAIGFFSAGLCVAVGRHPRMKALSKLISLILITLACWALVAALVLTSSSLFASGEKTFTAPGFSITLNSTFSEDKTSAGEYGYELFIESNKTLVMVMKEPKADFASSEISNVADYAKAFAEYNNINAEIKTEASFLYLEYTATVDGTDFYYVDAIYNGTAHYWVSTFACEAKDQDSQRSKFLEWAAAAVVG